MQLEDEQIALLKRFVEAHRDVPQESRGEFIADEPFGADQATFIHSRKPDVRFYGSLADANVLADAGFLKRSIDHRGTALYYYVLPKAIAQYAEAKRSRPAANVVEAEVRGFLSAPEFAKVHGPALAKWEQAASVLWASDSSQQLTTIGHLCREALQAFAASFAQHHRVEVSHIGSEKTVARLKAVLAARAGDVRTTASEFLDALIAYWGTVSDLVQRQEHGSQREKTDLSWEDARRVVFQTCVVMYEVHRAVPHS